MDPDVRVDRRAPVLLLESHEAVRRLRAQALRAEGFDVTSVADSEEALASAVRRMPRMVVASFDPQTREDRFLLCLRLKADERLRSVPVLLTSTDLDDDDLRRATDLRLLVIATSPGDCGKVLGAVGGMLCRRTAATSEV